MIYTVLYEILVVKSSVFDIRQKRYCKSVKRNVTMRVPSLDEYMIKLKHWQHKMVKHSIATSRHLQKFLITRFVDWHIQDSGIILMYPLQLAQVISICHFQDPCCLPSNHQAKKKTLKLIIMSLISDNIFIANYLSNYMKSCLAQGLRDYILLAILLMTAENLLGKVIRKTPSLNYPALNSRSYVGINSYEVKMKMTVLAEQRVSHPSLVQGQN